MPPISEIELDEVLAHIKRYPHFYYTMLADPTFIFDPKFYKQYVSGGQYTAAIDTNMVLKFCEKNQHLDTLLITTLQAMLKGQVEDKIMFHTVLVEQKPLGASGEDVSEDIIELDVRNHLPVKDDEKPGIKEVEIES